MRLGFKLLSRIRKACAVLLGRDEAPGVAPGEESGAAVRETIRSPSPPPPTLSARPGIACPRCAFHIEIPIPVLLSGMPIQCPGCALKLVVNQEKSADSLAALQKLHGDFETASEQLKAATGKR